MIYEIKQIDLTDSTALNSVVDFYKKYMPVSLNPTSQNIQEIISLYKTTAYVTANTLSQLSDLIKNSEPFIRNIPDNMINEITHMRSISIGDIVIDENQTWFYVNSIKEFNQLN